MVPLSGSARRRLTGEDGHDAGASPRACSRSRRPQDVERQRNTFRVFHGGRVNLFPSQCLDWINHHRAACGKIAGQNRDDEQQRRNDRVRQWVKGGDTKQQ